jgi:hypothetical protein
LDYIKIWVIDKVALLPSEYWLWVMKKKENTLKKYLSIVKLIAYWS